MGSRGTVFKSQIFISFLSFVALLFVNSLSYGQWTSFPPPFVSSGWDVSGVYFTSSGEGWAVGGDNVNRRGALLHYSEGAWSSVTPPSVSADWDLSGIYFTSPSEGWAVGEDSSNSRGVLLHFILPTTSK